MRFFSTRAWHSMSFKLLAFILMRHIAILRLVLSTVSTFLRTIRAGGEMKFCETRRDEIFGQKTETSRDVSRDEIKMTNEMN